MDGGLFGAGSGAVDAHILAHQLGVDVVADPFVGVHQPTGALVADLAVVDEVLRDGLLPDLGLLLGQPFVQGLAVVAVAGQVRRTLRGRVVCATVGGEARYEGGLRGATPVGSR